MLIEAVCARYQAQADAIEEAGKGDNIPVGPHGSAIAKQLGMTEDGARFLLAMERGEIDGDIMITDEEEQEP